MASVVVKKALEKGHTLSIIVDGTNAVIIETLLNKVNSIHDLLEKWDWLKTRQGNYRLALDGGLCTEVVKCIHDLVHYQDQGSTVAGILKNGLLNMLQMNIAIDLYTPTKPIVVTVTDTGKHTLIKPQKFLGSGSASIPYFDKELPSGQPYFHVAILLDNLMFPAELAAIEALAVVTKEKEFGVHVFKTTYVGNMVGWIIPNTEENRKHVKLLFQRLQRRYDALDNVGKLEAMRDAINGLSSKQHGTGRFYGINNTRGTFEGVFDQLEWMRMYKLMTATKLGFKASLDRNQYTLSFI